MPESGFTNLPKFTHSKPSTGIWTNTQETHRDTQKLHYVLMLRQSPSISQGSWSLNPGEFLPHYGFLAHEDHGSTWKKQTYQMP